MAKQERITQDQAEQAVKWITTLNGPTMKEIARRFGMPDNDWSRHYLKEAIVARIGKQAADSAIRARKADNMRGNQHGQGVQITKKRRQEMSLRSRGANNPNWRGGTSYASKTYREFLTKILERDDYRCTSCESKGGWRGLGVHHHVSVKIAPERMMDPENCTTLCRECHAREHVKRGDTFTPEKCVRGERHPRSKLTEANVREIRERYASGESLQRELAKEFGVDHCTITQLINKKTWKHVE